MHNTQRNILGIDPGTTVMGYAIIETQGSAIQVTAMGVLELHKLDDHYQKLQRIFERTLNLIDQYQTREMALEAPFFGKNVQSMLKLGRAQGAAMAAGLYRKLPIFEYSPRKVKMATTGNGNASKEQVAAFLNSMLKLPAENFPLDATDALAVAICHSYQLKVDNAPSFNSWKDFLKQNPNRQINT